LRSSKIIRSNFIALVYELIHYSVKRIFLLLLIYLIACHHELSNEEKAEHVVKIFLSPHGKYEPIKFEAFDSSYTSLSKNEDYKLILSNVAAYHDSSLKYAGTDNQKADSFYALSTQLHQQRENLEKSFRPEMDGWWIIHSFKLDGQTWRDTFFIDPAITQVIGVKGT